MKTLRKLLCLTLAVLLCVAVFSACENLSKNSEWEKIAQTVIADTTKADANYKISQDVYNTIVDGNSMHSNDSVFYYSKYMNKEQDTLYFYDLHNDVWYKSPQANLGSTTLSKYIFNNCVLSILEQTLNDLDNVVYLGGHKYSYTFVSEIGLDVVGYDPVFNYTFTTDGERITEIMLRGKTYKITYGGQTIVVPDAIEPQKLPSPQNLSIDNGVLSWDSVDMAVEYVVTIYSGSHYWGAQTVQTTSMNLYERLASQVTGGPWTYQITVKAYFPVFVLSYSSEESMPIDYIFNH